MPFLFGVSCNHRDKIGKDRMSRSGKIDMSNEEGGKYDSHNVMEKGHDF